MEEIACQLILLFDDEKNGLILQDYTSVDGSPLPRCNSNSYYSASSSSRVRCPADMIVNPSNSFKYVENYEISKATSYVDAVQVKPQHVSLKLRVNVAHDLDFYYEQVRY